MSSSAPRLRDYVRHLRDTRTEIAIFVACVLVVLVLADPLLMVAIEALAPALHAKALAIDTDLRRWIVGLPPALMLLLGAIWLDWRRLRRDNWEAAGFVDSSRQQ